jgi:DNA-damage-inducible protein J
MASNQLVQTRIDGAIKEEAAVVLAAMGLTVSDAVRMLLENVSAVALGGRGAQAMI